jgi:hypothetical protein
MKISPNSRLFEARNGRSDKFLSGIKPSALKFI